MTESAELPDLVCHDGRHRPLWMRVTFLTLGILCVALGFVGWLVPVITGIPFYILAVVCFAKASRRLGSWINVQERKLPRGLRRALRPRLWRRTRSCEP